jgi:H+-translocating NAD(P) transhydrogenase subunit alpha
MEHLYILVLAIFLGFEVITKVPTLLHTPLMSGTNAISGIILIGAIIIAPNQSTLLGEILVYCAVFFSSINVIGGFAVTDRMLAMFRSQKS